MEMTPPAGATMTKLGAFCVALTEMCVALCICKMQRYFGCAIAFVVNGGLEKIQKRGGGGGWGG